VGSTTRLHLAWRARSTSPRVGRPCAASTPAAAVGVREQLEEQMAVLLVNPPCSSLSNVFDAGWRRVLDWARRSVGYTRAMR